MKRNILYLVLYTFLLSSTNLNLLCFASEQTIKNIFESNELSEPIKLEARIDVPLELNLEKALNYAILQNLNIAQAKHQQDVSKWLLLENLGNFLPDYRLGYLAQRLDGNFLIGGVFPVMALTSSINTFMRFDYRFFEGGKGLFNTLSAKNLYKSSKENVLASLNDVLLSVTRAYNRLLLEEAQLEVLAKALEEAKADLELNENLEKEGVGTRFDVLQSVAQASEQEQEFIEQEARFREASIYLATLLDLDQGTHIKPDKNDLKVQKLFDVNKPIQELISLAQKNRPEIKKTQLEYNSFKNNIGVAYSGFLPKANFFGQYGGTGNAFFHRTKVHEVIPDAIALNENGNPVPQMVSRDRNLYQAFQPQVDLSNITNVSNVIRGGGKPFTTALDDSLMASRFLGVEVGWDIGDGLGVPTLSRINRARNQAKIVKTNLEILKNKIEEEVRSIYLEVQTTEKLLSVANKRLEAASEAFRLAKVRLENGVGINTELLSSQKQYASALASQVNAIIKYNNAQAELLHSLGIISVERLITK